MTGYTHAISFYKKVDGDGWTFESVKTTTAKLHSEVSALYKQQTNGTVRAIETIKLRVA